MSGPTPPPFTVNGYSMVISHQAANKQQEHWMAAAYYVPMIRQLEISTCFGFAVFSQLSWCVYVCITCARRSTVIDWGGYTREACVRGATAEILTSPTSLSSYGLDATTPFGSVPDNALFALNAFDHSVWIICYIYLLSTTTKNSGTIATPYRAPYEGCMARSLHEHLTHYERCFCTYLHRTNKGGGHCPTLKMWGAIILKESKWMHACVELLVFFL